MSAAATQRVAMRVNCRCQHDASAATVPLTDVTATSDALMPAISEALQAGLITVAVIVLRHGLSWRRLYRLECQFRRVAGVAISVADG